MPRAARTPCVNGSWPRSATRFPDHGIELVGAFVDAATGRLTYLTRFPDEEARAAAWASFGSDPGWQAAKKASEVDGPLVVKAARHASCRQPWRTCRSP